MFLPIAAMMAGDPAGAYRQGRQQQQQVDTGDDQQAGDAAFGRALMSMYGQAMPGAQPPTTVPPGQPSQPFRPQMAGGAFPQGPPMGGAAPDQPMPQQPPMGPPQGGMRPPMPGGPPMQPGMGGPPGGAPMQPGMPPMGGGGPMRPGMPPMGGGAPGGMQPGGGAQGMTWQSAVQAVARANPGIEKNPRALARAVDHFLPIMNQQSLQEWRQQRMELMGAQLDVREEGIRSAERRVREQQEGLDRREGVRGDVRREGYESAERREGMRGDVRREGYDSAERRTQMNVEQRDRANKVRRELGLGAIDQRDRATESRERVEGRRIESREGIEERRESGRMARAQLSAETRKDVAKLSVEAREEIARAAERGRTDRASLSRETQIELERMREGSRKELTEYLEGGRNTRFEQGLTSREDQERTRQEGQDRRLDRREEGQDRRFDTAEQGRQSRSVLSEEGRDRRLERGEEGRERRFDVGEQGRQSRAVMGEEGRRERATASERGRQDRFEAREGRIERHAQVREDQQVQRLDLQRQNLERQITQGGQRQKLGEWRAVIDAQHKRAMEIIGSATAGGTGMPDPKERARLLKEEDAFYRQQIEQMRSGGSGNKDMKTGPGTVEGIKLDQSQLKDPDGTRYPGSDGKTYIKRGNTAVPE